MGEAGGPPPSQMGTNRAVERDRGAEAASWPLSLDAEGAVPLHPLQLQL